MNLLGEVYAKYKSEREREEADVKRLTRYAERMTDWALKQSPDDLAEMYALSLITNIVQRQMLREMKDWNSEVLGKAKDMSREALLQTDMKNAVSSELARIAPKLKALRDGRRKGGQKGAETKRKESAVPRILTAYERMKREGVPDREIASKIARRVGVSSARVRQVLQEKRNGS